MVDDERWRARIDGGAPPPWFTDFRPGGQDNPKTLAEAERNRQRNEREARWLGWVLLANVILWLAAAVWLALTFL